MTAKKMSIFITGAGGMIGRNLLPHLLGLGYQVTVLKHHQQIDYKQIQVVEGDIRCFNPLWIKNCDIVIHLAAATVPPCWKKNGFGSADRVARFSPEDSFNSVNSLNSVNIDGTRSLITAINSQQHKVRLIYTSSIAALGPSSNYSGPITDYGFSKLIGEKISREVNDHVIVRLPMVIAPNDRVTPRFKKLSALRCIPITNSKFSAVDVSDVLKFIALIISDDSYDGRTFMLGDGEEYSWKSVAKFYQEKYKHRIFTPRIPKILLQPFIFSLFGNADISYYLKYDWFHPPEYPTVLDPLKRVFTYDYN
ncbi:MAG: NAD(P)-dependent oxidoreductase [Oligoflexia bacterium]|nr:NAD(P)-dependent oxidoreductase [Oligoflexia bacterium]